MPDQIYVIGHVNPDTDSIASAMGYAWLPVSYTHLRAHETVLDLVCRLLLEKKNTQLTFTIFHSSYTYTTV